MLRYLFSSDKINPLPSVMDTAAAPPSSARIPSLDGWRGVAIVLVLFEHFQYTIFGGSLSSWMRTGQHGVTIFFVLSGFLITTTLVKGPINFRRFYIRRFFRLMPVAWSYLLFLEALDLIFRTKRVLLPELFRL